MNTRLANISSALGARLGKPTKGAAAVEYPLIVFLISLVLVPALIIFGPALSSTFTKLTDGWGIGNTGGKCQAGSNSNHYFDNWYWSYEIQYHDTATGALTGTLVYNAANPDGTWIAEVKTPANTVYYPWVERGAFVSMTSSVQPDWTGNAIAYTTIQYANGTARAWDNDMGIFSAGPRPTQKQVEDYIATLGYETGFEASQTPKHTALGSGFWDVPLMPYAEYPALTGDPGQPQNVTGSPDGSRGGVQRATPPAGADLACPTTGGDTGSTHNGVACDSGNLSNGYFDNQYWIEDRNYYSTDYSTNYGNLHVDGTGSHWYGNADWNRGGVEWTQAEADAAVASGDATASSTWSASVDDNGGKLYATAPQEALSSGNIGCPSSGGGGLG